MSNEVFADPYSGFDDPDSPAPDQAAYDQMVRSMRPPVVTVPLIWEDSRWQEQLSFMLRVLGRLGFIQHSPREIKTWPIYPTPFISSWGSIDIAQLEACIKEELSK